MDLKKKKKKKWDAATGAPIGAIVGNYLAIADDFSLAVASKGSTITLYDVKRCSPVGTLSSPSTNIVRLTISSDGSRFATISSGGTVDLWDNKKRDVVARCDGLGPLKFSPSGANLAFRSGDYIKLLDATSGELVAELNHRQYHSCDNIVKLVFSSDGSRLAYISTKYHESILGSGGVLTLWISENSESWTFAGFTTEIVGMELAISTDASLIGTIVYWGDLRSVLLLSGNRKNPLNLVRVLEQSFVHEAHSLAISRDGILAIGVNGPVAVILYDTKTHSFVSRLPSPTLYHIVAFSPDCTRLAAVNLSTMGMIQLWDLEVIRATSPFVDEPTNMLTVLFFSPDCLHLASGYEDGTVRLWDTRHKKRPIATFKASLVPVTAFAFSTSGLLLASGSADGTIKLWNISDGLSIGSFQYHQSIEAIVILADALAIMSSDDRVTLWDLKEQRSTHIISMSAQGLWSLRGHDTLFAYCGVNISSSKRFRHLTIWDTKKYQEFATVADTSLDVLVAKYVGMVALSLDKSNLVVDYGDEHHLRVFHVFYGKIIPEPRQYIIDHLPIIRRWHGIPVWLTIPSIVGGQQVMGQFSPGEVPVPLVYIPEELRTAIVARGSSMFALGSEDGHIFIIRSFPAE